MRTVRRAVRTGSRRGGVEGGFVERGGVAGGEEEAVAFAEGEAEGFGEADHHFAAGAGAALFQEAEMALGGVGGDRQVQLAPVPQGAPAAQFRRESAEVCHDRHEIILRVAGAPGPFPPGNRGG